MVASVFDNLTIVLGCELWKMGSGSARLIGEFTRDYENLKGSGQKMEIHRIEIASRSTQPGEREASG